MRAGSGRSTEVAIPSPSSTPPAMFSKAAKSNSLSPQPNAAAGTAPGSPSAAGSASQSKRVRTWLGRPWRAGTDS